MFSHLYCLHNTITCNYVTLGAVNSMQKEVLFITSILTGSLSMLSLAYLVLLLKVIDALTDVVIVY